MMAVLLMAIIFFGSGADAGTPNLVPMPKLYKSLGVVFDTADCRIFTDMGNPQCRLAAEEINKRIHELSGKELPIERAENTSKPGIYILPVQNSRVNALIKSISLKVTEKDPGPQGYVMDTDIAGKRLAIIGSDNIGTLYGAMTLRQMLQQNGKDVVLQAARVYDKPDYRYRSNAPLVRRLGNWAQGETSFAREAAYKAAIDWTLRFKMNVLFDAWGGDVRKIPPGERAFIRRINDYAIERGIYPAKWESTYLGWGVLDKERPEFKDWDCVYKSGDGGCYYCWSRDDLAREKIGRTADFFRECHFKMMFLHPVDGGGAADPESWSTRCRLCRQSFGNDRWKGSVHQFNLWSEIFAAKASEVTITSCIYPYNARYTDFSRFTGISESIWRKNSLDYWHNVHKGADSGLMPMTWMALPGEAREYRHYFSGRAMTVYAHSFVPLGYFGTWHRLNGSNFDGNTGDIFLLEGGYDLYEAWMSAICSAEYTWNTSAPGSETFKGWYYDAERDHREPRVIMEEWLPRACKAFFGQEVGSRIVPVFSSGVLNLYITDPGRGMFLANKYRRTPLADVDPDNTAPKDIAFQKYPDLIDGPERMAAQVKATSTAMAALDAAYPYIGTLDKYRRKTFIYYYKRMPLWHMIAEARYAVYAAGALADKGKAKEAADLIDEAAAEFERDWGHAEKVLKASANEPDIVAGSPIGKKGDIRISPEEIRKMLRERRLSLKVSLKPRVVKETIRVGLYNGLGAVGTKEYLDGFANVKAEIIDSLSLSALDKYDCVFVFQSKSISRDDYLKNLRRYVIEGGRGLVLQHDLCGFERSPFGRTTPFPEICVDALGRKDDRELVIRAAHSAVGGLPAGKGMEHMYYDHLLLSPGPQGVTVVADKDGNSVVVLGLAGSGKVLFDGNINIDSGDKEAPLTGFNALLARGVLEWFTGVKLREKE